MAPAGNISIHVAGLLVLGFCSYPIAMFSMPMQYALPSRCAGFGSMSRYSLARKAIPDSGISEKTNSSSSSDTSPPSAALAGTLAMAVVCGIAAGFVAPSAASAEASLPTIEEKAAMDLKWKEALKAQDTVRDLAETEANRKLSNTTSITIAAYEREITEAGQKFTAEANKILETKKNELEANSKLRPIPFGTSEKDAADQVTNQKAYEAMRKITDEKRQKEEEAQTKKLVALESAKSERLREYRQAAEKQEDAQQQIFKDKRDTIASWPTEYRPF